MTSQNPSLFGDAPVIRASKSASQDICKKCHSAIWTVVSRDGFKVHLDVTSISPFEDLDCFDRQIPTYLAWRNAESFEVDYRTPIRIIFGDQGQPILKTHECRSANQVLNYPDLFPSKELLSK